jgi:hypothetical protein
MKDISKLMLLVFLVVVVTFSLSYATGTPKLISYQGKITDAGGSPVADGTHDIWLFLYTNSAASSNVWSDNIQIQTRSGLFSYILGSDPSALLPDSIFSKYDSLFLGIMIEGELQAPLTPLTAAPYAFRVNSIDQAKGGAINGGITFVDTTAEIFYATIRKTHDTPGAGEIEIQRKEGAGGISLRGSHNGTEQPYLAMQGDSRYVTINLNNSGNNSVSLPADAIGATEIRDEPGVGSYINETGYSVNSTGVTYLGSRAMFSPADGFVLVIASAEVTLTHMQGLTDTYHFGVSDDCNSLYSSSRIALKVPSSLPFGSMSYPITVHGLFPVDSGTTTFCFLTENTAIGTLEISNITISELFVPTAYTTVISPSSPSSSNDPDTERALEEAYHNSRVTAELEKMKMELERIREELKENQTSSQRDNE